MNMACADKIVVTLQEYGIARRMNLQNISALCSPSHVLAGRVTLVTPAEFRNIEGCSINDCRLLILVSRGWLTLLVNGRESEMHACSLLDLLDWASVKIVRTSPDLQAYCLLPTFEFTGESMNGLKPGPENYFRDRLYLPVIGISERDNEALVGQLQALERALSDFGHYYRQEMVRAYFRLFLLELGNIMLMHQKENSRSDSTVGRRDIIVTDFLKLVWKYFRTERSIGFYAGKLNITPKHLARTVKGMLGKRPHEIIDEELVQYASTLLKNDRLSILEISVSLCFSEQAAFCKFFRKHTGVTPSEYRRRADIKRTGA